MNKQDIDDIDATLDEAQIVSDSQSDKDLPEAPASATIKVWIKGFGVMLTVMDNKANLMLKKVQTIIEYAESHNWKNVWDTLPAPGQVILPQPTNPQASVCGIHGTAMTWKTGVSKKTSKPYAFWACSTKNADGTYCSFQPEKK